MSQKVGIRFARALLLLSASLLLLLGLLVLGLGIRNGVTLQWSGFAIGVTTVGGLLLLLSLGGLGTAFRISCCGLFHITSLFITPLAFLALLILTIVVGTQRNAMIHALVQQLDRKDPAQIAHDEAVYGRAWTAVIVIFSIADACLLILWITALLFVKSRARGSVVLSQRALDSIALRRVTSRAAERGTSLASRDLESMFKQQAAKADKQASQLGKAENRWRDLELGSRELGGSAVRPSLPSPPPLPPPARKVNAPTPYADSGGAWSKVTRY